MYVLFTIIKIQGNKFDTDLCTKILEPDKPESYDFYPLYLNRSEFAALNKEAYKPIVDIQIIEDVYII